MVCVSLNVMLMCVCGGWLGRMVRFADVPQLSKKKKKRVVKKTKAITPLQAMMLRMAGTHSLTHTHKLHFPCLIRITRWNEVENPFIMLTHELEMFLGRFNVSTHAGVHMQFLYCCNVCV